MQEKHKEAIQRNFSSLVERTDLDATVTALFEKEVFSEQMIEPFRDSYETPRERKRKLYREITRRGPQAFDRLVEVLMEMGQWDLVRDLDPDSPLHFGPHRSTNVKTTPQLPKSDENNFLSLSTEKSKAKMNMEIQKSQMIAPPPPPSVNNNDSNEQSTDLPFFNVQKCTKFMEDDDSKDIKLYRTRGRQRGVLLVFSYTSFKNNIESFREGVDVDCKKLKYLFSEFGFKLLSYQNLTLQETRETLASLQTVLAGAESVFVVVSSHGYERRGSSDTDIRCSDGNLITYYEIIDYFNNRSLPALWDVPRVFIFQVCRGDSEEFVYSARPPPHLLMPAAGAGAAAGSGAGAARDGVAQRPDVGAQPPAARRSPPRPHDAMPLYTDMLIAHSTLPGFASHRDKTHGSWYIQALCEVFAARAHDCHVDKLFLLVDQRLRDRFRMQTSSVDRWGFNRKLYLHPGLYE